MPRRGGARAAGARRAHRHGELRGRHARGAAARVGAVANRHRQPAALHVAQVPGRAHRQELPPAVPPRGAAMPARHHHHALTAPHPAGAPSSPARGPDASSSARERSTVFRVSFFLFTSIF